MKCKLSKSILEKALAKKLPIQIWDTQIQGLYAEIRVTGRGSFFLRYTPTVGSPKKTLLIGPIGIVSLSDAREKARSILVSVYLGEEMLSKRERAIQSVILKTVFETQYLPYVKTYKRSWATDLSLYRNHIAPTFASYPITSIKQQSISQLHEDLRLKGYSASTCNRVIILLRFLFNLAIHRWKLPGLKTNPTQGVRLYPVHNHKQRFLSHHELAELLKATQCQEYTPLLPYIVALLSLTGARRRNVLDAQWQMIDFDHQRWVIPMTKSGRSQTIYLSQEAINLISVIPRTDNNPYLFPSPKTGKPYQNINKGWNEARQLAGLPALRIHDLRHTFASLLINSGHSLYVVQSALGHQTPSMTSRYAHLSDQTLKNASDAVGQIIHSGLETLLRR